MRFNKGHVRVNRELLEEFNGYHTAGWVYFLIAINANWEDGQITYKNKRYLCKTGELKTTYRRLRDWSGIGHYTITKAIKFLIENKYITDSKVKGSDYLRSLVVLDYGSFNGSFEPPQKPLGNNIINKESKKVINNNTTRAREADASTPPPSEESVKCDGSMDSNINSKGASSNVSGRKSKTGSQTPQRKKTSKKERILVWDSEHEFGGIFKNLLAEKYYRAVFDLKTDETKIRQFIDRYNITISELEEISFQYQNWCSSKASPIKSPRGTLVTFIRNYVNSDKKLSTKKKSKDERGPGFFDVPIDEYIKYMDENF